MSVIGSNILAGASGQGGSYQISRSVRFRSSASASFSRTPASAGNQKTWTWSGWVKRGSIADSGIFSAGTGGTNYFNIRFQPDYISVVSENSSLVIELRTTPLYRDPSAWYHIVFALDTTQATSTNRAKLYVNGVQVTAFFNTTYPSLNLDMVVNSAVVHYNGRTANSAINFDGYLTEINFIDGQALTPSSFGETDTLTGVWKPKKYAGTYGTNGFYLNFSDNSGATATTIGKDYSGNGNNWTPNNISVTAGVTYDSMLDVPTPYADGGNGRGNYCVLNPLDKGSSGTMADGNLSWSYGSASWQVSRATMALPSTGKWYWEVPITSLTSYVEAGVATSSASLSAYIGNDANGWSWQSNATKLYNGTGTSYGTSASVNDVLMVAVDRGSSKIWVGRQGTWLASGDPAAGTNEMFSGLTTGDLFAAVACYKDCRQAQ